MGGILGYKNEIYVGLGISFENTGKIRDMTQKRRCTKFAEDGVVHIDRPL